MAGRRIGAGHVDPSDAHSVNIVFLSPLVACLSGALFAHGPAVDVDKLLVGKLAAALGATEAVGVIGLAQSCQGRRQEDKENHMTGSPLVRFPTSGLRHFSHGSASTLLSTESPHRWQKKPLQTEEKKRKKK